MRRQAIRLCIGPRSLDDYRNLPFRETPNARPGLRLCDFGNGAGAGWADPGLGVRQQDHCAPQGGRRVAGQPRRHDVRALALYWTRATLVDKSVGVVALGEPVSLSASDRRKCGRARVPLWRAAAVAAAYLLTVWGCSGGSGSGGPGSLDVRPVWPQPGGGESTAQLPAAAQTVRVTFDSEAGLRCCLAIDPTTVPIDPTSGARLLVLDQLPPGPATFTMTAFTTDFAPAADGVTELCPTNPPGVGQACDATRPASPAFQSQPQPVTIVAGTRTQAIDVGLVALPFVFDLQPPPGDSTASPVPVAFTAADAVTGIDGNSITVEASFRSLSKRVAVTLSPCDDKTASPCSQQGYLQVMGFRAVSTPVPLPPGPASLRITGRDLASPPGELDFIYDFTVVANGQAAAAHTVTSSPQSLGPSASDRTDPGATAEQQARGTTSTLSVVTVVPIRTATNTPAPVNHRPATPTATATPTAAHIPEGPS